MEKVSLEDRATFGRIVTAIKDTVVESLSWTPFTKASRYPAAILVRFERIVRNRGGLEPAPPHEDHRGY